MSPSLLAAAVVGTLALGAPTALVAQGGKPKTTVTATAKGGIDPKGKRQIICRGAKIPAGWVLVDDLRDTQQCDGTNPAAVKLYNVWSIEQVEGRASGSTIEICSSSPTPAGWTLVDVFRDKDRCGHPDELFSANVKRIRKS
ncbi:MAG: hypothetical protein HY275_18115 [Gemmatimonadetes bacterium]|nr:hypothetical protein [Gemmatimonadota bacterium]